MPTYEKGIEDIFYFLLSMVSFFWISKSILMGQIWNTQQFLDLNDITQFYYLTVILLVTSVKKMNNGARMNER